MVLRLGSQPGMILAITIVKGVHIAGILVWSAGLLGLPLLLAQHRTDASQADYSRMRHFTHYAYTRVLTPAAVIAVAAGTALLFLRDVFTPWMFAKLVFVGALVALHAWVGALVVEMGEHTGKRDAPSGIPAVLAASVLIIGILTLVLGKPALDGNQLPEWLLTPRNRHLPVDEVPS